VPEQPLPLVEILSWEEMCSTFTGTHCIFERKARQSGTIWRGRLAGIRYREDILCIECAELFAWRNDAWAPLKEKEFKTNIAHCELPPIRLVDGRVFFAANGFDCTLYAPDSDVNCPE
jgi:hypothetical protein